MKRATVLIIGIFFIFLMSTTSEALIRDINYFVDTVVHQDIGVMVAENTTKEPDILLIVRGIPDTRPGGIHTMLHSSQVAYNLGATEKHLADFPEIKKIVISFALAWNCGKNEISPIKTFIKKQYEAGKSIYIYGRATNKPAYKMFTLYLDIGDNCKSKSNTEDEGLSSTLAVGINKDEAGVCSFSHFTYYTIQAFDEVIKDIHKAK